jgi:hypothetical protein
MDALKKARGTVRGALWEGQTFYIGFGTNRARHVVGVVDRNTFDGRTKTFNAYVSHKAV